MSLTLRKPVVASSNNNNKYLRTSEILNGRLAMLGFTAGAGQQLVTGQTIVEQAQDPLTMVAVACIAPAIVYATNVTLDERLDGEPCSDIWTPDAELANGRLAMVGMAGLAVQTFF